MAYFKLPSLKSKDHSALLQDFLALYGLQLGNFLIPILTFPVLARKMSHDDWAYLLIAQSLAIMVTTFIEYGHNITATRQIAEARSEMEISKIIKLVSLSKILLSLICLVVAVIIVASGLVSEKINSPLLLIAVFYGIIQGNLPIWYFQGLQRPRVSAIVTMIFKIISAIGMMLIVFVLPLPLPVLIIQFVGMLLTYIILIYLLFRERINKVSVRIEWLDVALDLRSGFTVFVFRLLGSSYTSGLALLLSTVVPPSVTAFILSSDRIAKVAPSLAVPFCQAIYPRIVVNNMYNSTRGLKKVVLYGFSVFFILFVSSLLLFLIRDQVVSILLGEKYLETIKILSWTVWIMPFFGLNTVFFTLWIFPAKKDRTANFLLFINASSSLIWVLMLYNKLDLAIYSCGIYAGEVVIAVILTTSIFARVRAISLVGEEYA